ncbi:MAG: 16S rRNA (adenine(1518)-N(6)/adenine(1519)-N(6))-dimethyltransferase RsmA [Candidatus Margulisiibacteriota bacterium]
MHRLGQVFLHDKNILDKLVAQANIQPGDTVVEIGCGHGILTERLVAAGASLTVIEIDPDCMAKTQDRLASRFDVVPPITWVCGDVLTQTLSGKPAQVVANIPYYISKEIVLWLVRNRTAIAQVQLMVQQEFFDKLRAKPGSPNYGFLSALMGLYGKFGPHFPVSRRSFRPVPHVDSTVFSFAFNPTPPPQEAELFALLQAAFWGKRRALKTVLKKNPFWQPSAKALEHLDSLPSTLRAQDLAPEAFLDLGIALF